MAEFPNLDASYSSPRLFATFQTRASSPEGRTANYF